MPRKRKSVRRTREGWGQRAQFVIDANPTMPPEIVKHHQYLNRCAQFIFNHPYDKLSDKQKSRLHEALNNVSADEPIAIRMRLMAEGLVQQ